LQSGDSETQSYFDFNLQEGFKKVASGMINMFVAKLWTIPFRNMCLVLFENRDTGCQELVWVNTKKKLSQLDMKEDLRLWALNRNVFLEHEGDFVVPLRLDGSASDEHPSDSSDVLLKGDDPILVASTKDGCFSVVLGGRLVLVFDDLKKHEQAETWRNHLTEQFIEPNRSISSSSSTSSTSSTFISAACYVLDWLLLLASNDGIIRAHPRSNPKSEYYVENIHSFISQMTWLYNIVAIIHGYCTLEVRRATRIADDPFIHFNMLYRFLGVDCDHAPLLMDLTSFLLGWMVFGIESCMMVVLRKSEKKSRYRITQDGRFCQECQLEVFDYRRSKSCIQAT
jgi:hypothetical protein